MSVPVNWVKITEVGEWDYSWSISRVYQDTTSGFFFVLHDSGCSCSVFEEDDAEQSGPFTGAVEVIQGMTSHYGLSVDEVVSVLTAVDKAAQEYKWR